MHIYYNRADPSFPSIQVKKLKCDKRFGGYFTVALHLFEGIKFQFHSGRDGFIIIFSSNSMVQVKLTLELLLSSGYISMQ